MESQFELKITIKMNTANNINSSISPKNIIEDSSWTQPAVFYIVEESMDELLQIGLANETVPDKSETVDQQQMNGTAHSRRKSDESTGSNRTHLKYEFSNHTM